MSRERRPSVDRAQGRKNLFKNIDVYIPERSPNRTHNHAGHHNATNTSDICGRNYGGANGDRSTERNADHFVQRPYNVENLYAEYLDDFEEPSFSELPANSSFDEVMFTMATPPTTQPSVVKTSERGEVTNLQIDNLRKRIGAHIGTTAQNEQSVSVQIDDVKRRINAAISKTTADTIVIPPPPKDPKDVLAIIRRARAIAMLKELEDAKAPTKTKKDTIKKIARGNVSQKDTSKRNVRSVPVKIKIKKPHPPLPTSKTAPPTGLQKKGAIPKTKISRAKTQHPPDYVSDEYAAAILRARKLAGLRTTNPKLLQKPKIQQASTLEPPVKRPPSPDTAKTPTLENIIERVTAIRSKAAAATAPLIKEQQSTLTPNPEDELDEFEALEELYGAAKPEQYHALQQDDINLRKRILALQQQLLRTPPHVLEEISDEYEAVAPELGATAAAEIGLGQEPDYVYPSRTRSRSPAAPAQSVLPQFDNRFLENIDIPEFDIDDIPEFAFSAEALADAGFLVEDEVSLSEISMPDFDEDISFNEALLEDVTSPELLDLSVSADDLAIEPDYPIEISTEDEREELEKLVAEEMPKEEGFLTSMVNAVVDRFRNMFSPSEDGQKEIDENELDLDTSLPNMFESTPPSHPKTPVPKSTEEKPLSPKVPVVIPPHPKDPKDYRGMVKRAQAIQMKKAEESAIAEALAPLGKEKREKREIKTTIPKRAPPPRKKTVVQKKKNDKKTVYPPGEYSPSYIKAVARARSLAGLKNLSTLLNPERAAKLAERQAAREAEIAAIESLPPIERMREKMRKMRESMGGLPRPSIEALATLEAIRANLPKPKRKWRPTARLRADFRVKPSERVFRRDFGRILVPTKRTTKPKGRRSLDVMSPIAEEPQLEDDNLIKFSPLKPHEGEMRLRFIQKQAAMRAAEAIKTAQEKQTEISLESPSRTERSRVPQISPLRLSPIRMLSPSSPRTEETRREKIIRQLGPHGGSETIREEVNEISTIENGEVHTSTRQVTTKTDEYGNVTRHVHEGKGLSGEEDILPEDLDEIEPPDFFNTSDVPPSDPSIPTPDEIINRIRSNVHQQLSLALPDVPQSPATPSPASPGIIQFPQNLPNEELFYIEAPEFERTPPQIPSQLETFSPIEIDQRMYAWGEHPAVSQTPRVSIPKDSNILPETVQQVSASSKPKSPDAPIHIPPHPKDPKDYKTMIKRAQAIQKLKKQQEDLEIKTASAKQPFQKSGRVPISRWSKLPQDPKKLSRKRLVLKKRFPKVLPKKVVEPREEEEEAALPPQLSERYRAAVAQTRLMHGLENRTAALNPTVAAKLAAEEAAQAAFDALPEVEKIKKRMEKLRRAPGTTHRVEPSADILGILAAIRANMPSIEEVLRQPTSTELPVSTEPISPHTPATAYPSASIPLAPIRVRARPPTTPSKSDKSFNAVQITPDVSLDEFEALEAQMKSDISLEEFEALESEAKQLYDYDTQKRSERHRGRRLLSEFISSTEFTYPRHEVYFPSTALLAPSMRMLAEAGFFQDQVFLDEESERVERPYVTPRPEADTGSIHSDLMQDFRVDTESIDLESSQLMLTTPPRGIQERFRRLKEAQTKSSIPSEHAEQFYETPITPPVDFIPIRFISPSESVSTLSEDQEQLTSSELEENEWLININETPEREIHPVKQFGHLEDMPFDELEYEIEPNLANISLEEPLSPVPTPSDIINRIRSAYHQNLKELTKRSTTKSPEMLKLPEDLTDEKLLDLSAPSFAQTPKTPPKKYESPRVSLPMAWGEVHTITPGTPVATVIPSPHKLTPVEKTLRPTKDRQHKISTPEGQIVIPPHPKDPKDYMAMINRAKAIDKLNKQRGEQAKERDAVPTDVQRKGRVPISRWQGPAPRKQIAKLRKRLVLKKRDKVGKKASGQQPLLHEEEEYPAEPPPLPQEYRDAVAKARLLHGLQNRTAALNPKIAAKIAAKRAAEEAAAQAFNALPDHEKIKVRMERLRKKPHRRRAIKPTLDQIAYLEALKQIGEYQTSSPEIKSMPAASGTGFHQLVDDDSRELAELQQIQGDSLAEFEALESLEAPTVEHSAQPITPLDINKLISDLRYQLSTPTKVDPRERYRQLLSQRKTPTVAIASPVKTPTIRYSPIRLTSSPLEEETKKRAEISTTQITRSGNKSIREQVVEKSEIADGKLQHFTTSVTTTTDPQGNVTSQINENKRVFARDHSAELDYSEDLIDVQEPSFLDSTPLTPMDRPRPRDIIDRVGRQVRERYRPEVPTGHLIELRTPPPGLPFPTDVPDDELLEISYPASERTLPPSPTRSPVGSPDISIPQLFAFTPPPPSPASEIPILEHRILSPEGPIVIPPHPKDPTDYKAMVRRAKKIQQLIEQNEAESRAAEEAVAKAEKQMKKERVPISRWTTVPPRKPGTRKKLVMKRRGMDITTKAQATRAREKSPEEPPALPEYFAREVALARKLAGIKSRRPVEVDEQAAVSIARSPIKDYATVLSRMQEIKEKGATVRGQPSLASIAYLGALKDAMQVRQKLQQPATESPKTRYERILAARTVAPPTIEESPMQVPPGVDIPYSPIRFVSPRIGYNQADLAELRNLHEFDVATIENLYDLEELSEFEPPSYIDVSQYPTDEYQYTPLTPPTTPPPAPSAIISRIRRQYEQERAEITPESSISIPEAFEFPEDLPEEALFEISAPYLAQSPDNIATPTKSPDISIPHYFEESPSVPKSITPSRLPTENMMPASPPLQGIFPGIKVKTPQGPIAIPPHPKDPTDVPAMIRRTQLIQKLRAREAAERAAAAKSAKVRVPISRRIPSKSTARAPTSRRIPSKLVPKKITAKVGKSRKLAETKTKIAPLSPKVSAPPISTSTRTTPSPPSYTTIMERVIALRANRQKIQPLPSARELTYRQHLINRQQRQERKRLLNDLERLRKQQGFELYEIKTPPTARERLEAIKSRIQVESPISSEHPYSPVKTPEVIDVPQYQKITLPQSPPFEFLENDPIPDIEDISMPLDDLDNYTLEFETANEEDLEFQLAEIANTSHIDFVESRNIDNVEGTRNDLNISGRIRMLQQQLLESPPKANANRLEEYNMTQRLELLKNQLLRTPTQQESPTNATTKDYNFGDISSTDEGNDQQNIYEDMMDDFEAMEREYM